MAKYTVQVTDEFAVELDLPPNAPALRNVEVGFEANSEEELRTLVEQLGFDAIKLDVTSRVHMRWLRCGLDGEDVGRCTVQLWVGDGLVARPKPGIAALQLLRDEALAARERKQATATTLGLEGGSDGSASE